MQFYNPEKPSLELVALDMRNAKRQCKRPGRDIATRQLMGELHEKSMMGKHFRRVETSGRAPRFEGRETEKAQYERTRTTRRPRNQRSK